MVSISAEDKPAGDGSFNFVTGLEARSMTIDDRLDVLLHVKWTVKEFDCALTREIVELIDRETDLLNRGRSEKSLQGGHHAAATSHRYLSLFITAPCSRFTKAPIEPLPAIH